MFGGKKWERIKVLITHVYDKTSLPSSLSPLPKEGESVEVICELLPRSV